MLINLDYRFIVVATMFIVFDILTGVIGACVRGDFESWKMREGGKHKLFLIIVIAFGVSLDIAQYLVDLGINIPCATMICSYISIMEILSIVENINITFPNALPKALTDILYSKAEESGVPLEDEDK